MIDMALTSTHILQLCGFAVLLASGQVLFKMTASTLPPMTSVQSVFGLALNVWFWMAMVLYGLATLLWIFILQQVPLSLAYPFAALGFVIVPAAGFLIFKEPVNLAYILGALMIIGGLSVIAVMAPK